MQHDQNPFPLEAVFLDRDGVINAERSDYVKCWQEFRFLPGSLEALRKLASFRVPVFVVTNQSVIGRQIISACDVESIHRHMTEKIARVGLQLREIFICPHHPEQGCTCRKPAPGMLLRAAANYGLNLPHSYFIGDSITDYQAAKRCNCQPILVRSGLQGAKIDSLLESNLSAPIYDDLAGAVNHLKRLFRDISPEEGTV